MKASSILVIFIALAFANAQQLSDKARQLGLNQTWSAPFPTSPLLDDSAATYINTNWHNPNNYFYGTTDVSYVPDPITTTNNSANNNISSQVLQIKYNKGSYSPTGTKSSSASVGGAEFYSTPFRNNSYDSVLLRYDLAFDKDFDWVLGGKLPGLFGGPPGQGCSGGDKATGSNCFSVRLMWREAGSGEAYAYIPNSDATCSLPLVMCNDQYGTTFSRGLLQLKKGQWTKLELYIKINDPSKSNGILQVWQDDSLLISQTSLQYRTSNAVAISSLMFSTFFGGGTANYATPQDTYSYYRNVEYSVGLPVTLTPQQSSASNLARLSFTLLLTGFITLLYLFSL
ncbi:polysaccharide lyase family 14 protein [Phycomyces blakesleeanus]|uniref:Polysaccharide lyase family 14 protein n=2 Tax=Phycomyces blakesleeanus TaxID=4837 RepID=A0A167R5T4_PHYB8|nr:polysaccharide lyase family 14 protein [Phycomyces blakesleeanus NRRL 1555(-)]OAD80917.1 polysaccharide lyase family 14 protein [Phycomyces blakesleeanus NRRL 1555(-)]|eukprot:XP_018298957.1 polysaccharide lyase family 14 protein [Phycomyces blakesleeanus NRRL 1555(-)]